eukprot:g3900.t1
MIRVTSTFNNSRYTDLPHRDALPSQDSGPTAGSFKLAHSDALPSQDSGPTAGSFKMMFSKMKCSLCSRGTYTRVDFGYSRLTLVAPQARKETIADWEVGDCLRKG